MLEQNVNQMTLSCFGIYQKANVQYIGNGGSLDME